LDKSFEQRIAALRSLLETREDHLEESYQERRHHQGETQQSRHAIKSNRRNFLKDIGDEADNDENEQDLEARASSNSQTNTTGIVITLQNHAAMDTRLSVLYTDPQCQPYLVQSDTLLTHQTKSVTLPSNAQNIKVTVQKDMFANNWRDAHTFSMNGTRLCVRIVGVTVSSKLRPCE
ncbi:unnamed protein product, partial [Rotaria sp. Silwood1]